MSGAVRALKQFFLNSPVSTPNADNLHLVKFVFEDTSKPGELRNFIECKDVNRSGLSRFHPCILSGLTMTYDNIEKIELAKQGVKFEDPDQILQKDTDYRPYVISSGVRHHPVDWAHPSGKLSLFDYLNKQYLKDLKEGNAILLLDQSLEGYQTDWLWEWFHKDCERFGIPPSAIVYVTGNLNAPEDYKKWAWSKADKMKIIGFANFEHHIHKMAMRNALHFKWQDTISYKKANEIKTYNCLQKRLRPHRIYLYTELYKQNLLTHGLVSMNDYGDRPFEIEGQDLDPVLLSAARRRLPLEIYNESNQIRPEQYYVDRIRDNVCADTWVSLISEASFLDSDNSLFISEKTFKAIACQHPFIIVGNRYSLRKLREMGYKTFDGFIDESYDTLPTHERMQAIIESLKKITEIEDKLAWFDSMQDIVQHNYRVLHRLQDTRPEASNELVEYCKGYFKCTNG
jgi:hypothetical protein